MNPNVESVLLITGALLIVAGAFVFALAAGLITAGVLLVIAALDMATEPRFDDDLTGR